MRVEFQRAQRGDWAIGRRRQVMLMTDGHTARTALHLSLCLAPVRIVCILDGPLIDVTPNSARFEAEAQRGLAMAGD